MSLFNIHEWLRFRARLLYQSKKRGILENDILLGEFAESHLPKMNAAELAEYDKVGGDFQVST